MLTLRRNEGYGLETDKSTIDIEYKNEKITLSLVSIVDNEWFYPVSLWKVKSTDWGNEKYFPKFIGLTNNQPLIINDWLKIYGSKIAYNEATIHLSAPKEAIINRRDRN